MVCLLRLSQDLGGRALRISFFERTPTAMLIAPKDGGPSKFAGLDAWLLRLTARYLNFRVVVEQPQDKNGFGYLLENGSASGTFSHFVREN